VELRRPEISIPTSALSRVQLAVEVTSSVAINFNFFLFIYLFLFYVDYGVICRVENHREAFRRYIEGFRWVYKAGRLKIFSRSSYTSH
jgi:hypothetical protein